MAKSDLHDVLFHSKPQSTFSVWVSHTQDKYWKHYQSQSFTDLTLTCNDQQFKVHRLVMVTDAADVYQRLSDDESLKEIRYNANGSMMSKMIECIYRGSLSNIPEEKAKDLENVAKLLGVRQIELQCQRVILLNENPAIENCLHACQVALAIGDVDVLMKFQGLALENFPLLQTHPSFLTINMDTAMWYLGHEELHTAYPEDRLSAALTWLKSDPDNRLTNFEALLECLPINEMNQPFLRQIRNTDSIVSTNQNILLPPSKQVRSTAAVQHPAAQPCCNSISFSDHLLNSKNQKATTSYDGNVVSETCLAVVWIDNSNEASRLYIYPFSFDAPLSVTRGPESTNSITLAESACCSLGHNIYFSGLGDDRRGVWHYNVEKDRWLAGGSLLHARHGHCMSVVNGKIYVLAGDNPFVDSNKMIKVVEVLSISMDKACEAGQLQGSNCFFSCCCNYGNDILVLGGFRDPLIGKKTYLLQVYSTISKSVTHSIPLPGDFGDAPLGIFTSKEHVVFSNGKSLYSCLLQNLYRNCNEGLFELTSYSPPNIDALLVKVNEDKVFLVGGYPGDKADAKGSDKRVFWSSSSDVTENQGGWKPLGIKWESAISKCFPGCTCAVSVPRRLSHGGDWQHPEHV